MIRDTLLMLKSQGYSPRTMLDIGAHIGTFTQEFLGVFPGCVPTLVEPNPFCLADLGKHGFEQHGVAASSEPGIAEIFLSREWLQSTGASLYRENTVFFRDEVVVKRQVEKARLDDLFRGRRFDFVKIDTQGSELDVLLGGPAVLSHADFILIEVSLVEYNIGGARAEAVFEKLRELGFHCADVTDFHRLAGIANGNLLQMDFLFERRNRLSRISPATGAMDDLRNLAQSLYQDGCGKDASLIMNHLETIEPGQIDILKQRLKDLSASGQTLEALKILTLLKACAIDEKYQLEEIRERMPATLKRFNMHLAAGEIELAEKYISALAALLPGNPAILNAALSCNSALGRKQQAERYGLALLAFGSSPVPSQAAQGQKTAPPKKIRNARKG